MEYIKRIILLRAQCLELGDDAGFEVSALVGVLVWGPLIDGSLALALLHFGVENAAYLAAILFTLIVCGIAVTLRELMRLVPLELESVRFLRNNGRLLP